MTRYLATTLAATLAIGLASPAFANGYVAPAAPAPVAQTDWTGFYAGGQIDLIMEGSGFGGPFQIEVEGHFAGVFAGYRYDMGDVVIGGEIDYLLGSGEVTVLTIVADADYDLLRVGGEVGYDNGNMLPYLTAGFARMEIDAGAPTESNGYFAGAGLDFSVSESLTLGAELLFHDFRDWSDTTEELQLTTFGVNLAFRF